MRHEKEVIDSHDEKGKPLYHVCVCATHRLPTKDDNSLCFPFLVSVTHKIIALTHLSPWPLRINPSNDNDNKMYKSAGNVYRHNMGDAVSAAS